MSNEGLIEDGITLVSLQLVEAGFAGTVGVEGSSAAALGDDALHPSLAPGPEMDLIETLSTPNALPSALLPETVTLIWIVCTFPVTIIRPVPRSELGYVYTSVVSTHV